MTDPGSTETGVSQPVRVLVVEHQEFFRRGLTMLLAVEPGIEVVGEAGDGDEGLRLAVATSPDVVLLDLGMPAGSGPEVCLAIKGAAPASRIIMLTSSDEETDLDGSIESGASGYLLKDSTIEEVSRAVRVVADSASNPAVT